MPDNEDRAGERVWRAMPAGTREALDAPGAWADLQTLLIAVARPRADQTTPADVLRRWQYDRFVRPAAADPRRVAAVEARLWQLLPTVFTGVDLSPVTPLGTCTAVAPVSQNRVVTTVRDTEVVSDSTNALAVEAAVRRRSQQKTDTSTSRLPPPSARSGLRPRVSGGALPVVRPGVQRPRHRVRPHRGQPDDPAPGLLAGRA